MVSSIDTMRRLILLLPPFIMNSRVISSLNTIKISVARCKYFYPSHPIVRPFKIESTIISPMKTIKMSMQEESNESSKQKTNEESNRSSISVSFDNADRNEDDDDHDDDLYYASCNGDLNQARRALEKGAYIDDLFDKGYTALIAASMEGHWNVVKFLLENGAEVDHDESRVQALHAASHFGHLEVAQLLLDHGASVDYVGNIGLDETALHGACEAGHADLVELLLENEANIHARSASGWTPLHFASFYGRLAAAQVLLQKGANIHSIETTEPNSRHDHNRDTALHLACSAHIERLEMVQLLVQNGAKTNAVNRQGKRAYDCAVEKGYTDTAQFLLENMVNTNVDSNNEYVCCIGDLGQVLCASKKEEKGCTALIAASRDGNLAVVKFLLENSANVDHHESCVSALHAASHFGHLEIAQLLLGRGASVDYFGNDGLYETALHFACKAGHANLVTLLLKNEANVHARNKLGWTPLHFASFYGHLAAAQALLQNGANINAIVKYERNGGSDENKGTALHLACSGTTECLELVQLLVQYGVITDAVNGQGKRAIDCAVEKGYKDTAQFLLDNAINADADHHDG
jgi:ankyrin repeat protein